MIEQVAKDYPVQAACNAVGAELRPMVRRSFEKSRGTYGTTRIRIDLAREGKPCGRRRIGCLRENWTESAATPPPAARRVLRPQKPGPKPAAGKIIDIMQDKFG